MSEQPSIREQIEEIAVAMRHDPPPAEIRGYEVTLAGLLWRVSKEATTAEIAFRRAVNEAEGPSAKAREQIAKGTESFARLLEAKSAQEACKQMLMTCRSSLRSVSDEMRLAR
jgi:hypothetical protein